MEGGQIPACLPLIHRWTWCKIGMAIRRFVKQNGLFLNAFKRYHCTIHQSCLDTTVLISIALIQENLFAVVSMDQRTYMRMTQMVARLNNILSQRLARRRIWQARSGWLHWLLRFLFLTYDAQSQHFLMGVPELTKVVLVGSSSKRSCNWFTGYSYG